MCSMFLLIQIYSRYKKKYSGSMVIYYFLFVYNHIYSTFFQYQIQEQSMLTCRWVVSMISKVNQFKGHNLNNVHDEQIEKKLRIMVFNATVNNISVISWRSVLLVEKTITLSQGTDKLYHIMLYRVLKKEKKCLPTNVKKNIK